jgi:phospholipid-binding lipoprotein MlaA
MRKSRAALIFSMLWFTLPSDLSFSQSPEDLVPAEAITTDWQTESTVRFRLIPDGDLPTDISGGLLYASADEWNEKHRAFRVDSLPTELNTTRPSRTVLPPGDVIDYGSSERPLVLSGLDESEEEMTDPFEEEQAAEPVETIADPIEPINRAFFHFNDKLYFWLFKPISLGYRAVLPEPVRVGVRNFFDNLAFPIRFVNCLLQGKIQGAGDELTRFVVNSVSTLGFKDVAGDNMGMQEYDEDFGQTLQFYGLGSGFYINWPILGPSSLTDSVGIAGDLFLDPVSYIGETFVALPIRGLDLVNSTSLTIGDYEDLKRAALDPYVAIRDAYFQFRKNKIKE